VGESSGRPPDDANIARRKFVIGSQSVTCYEYLPSFLPRSDRIDDSTLALVECSGPGRLYASLSGKRIHIPNFYPMLSSIRRIEGN
jgi:hypothetical protein